MVRTNTVPPPPPLPTADLAAEEGQMEALQGVLEAMVLKASCRCVPVPLV
jgi:hypothetical protein